MDLGYLANLCHGCRGCFYACQYAPPHEFGINLPKVFAEIRQESYVEYSWPRPLGRLFERNGTVVSVAAALITALVIARRPGMLTMAAANPFGAFAFNAFAALGLPWAILGTYADIFPPARGTWYPSLIGFCAITLALLAIFANQLRLTRALGVYLLILYALYLAIIINDSAMRPARPPA